MELSSLIDDYRRCETELFSAIRGEDAAAIRELDIRMSWLRTVIREFNAKTETERGLQIDFFLDVVSKTSDQNPDMPPMADLRKVIDRNIVAHQMGCAPTRRDEARRIGTRIAETGPNDEDTLAMIENSNLRISVIDRDMRYRYASPASCRFHGMSPDDFKGQHLADVIGKKRYEKRAKAYLQRCFAGEDLSYCFYIDKEPHGRLLQECRLVPQYGAEDRIDGAIVILRDLTLGICDPVRSAEANLI